MSRLVPHALCIGERSWTLLAGPGPEPDLEGVSDPERIPYWSVLWDSGLALAHHLAARPTQVRKPVLELGCGAGLAGLVAASLGAEVTQSDLFPEALDLARRNANLNEIAGIRRVAADWRRWPLQGAWPLVLGADLLYDRASHAPLLQVLDAALAPGGAAYLTHPGRSMAAGFRALTEAAGWCVSRSDLGRVGVSRVELLILRRA